MMRAMCGVQLNDRKRSKDLMLTLHLNKTIDQLAMENNVYWHDHLLRMALDFEVDGQRKKGRPKRTLKKQVEKEFEKVSLRRKDTLCPSKVECRRESDCYCIEMNLATLTCWGYYLTLNIGVSLSLYTQSTND